MNKQNWMDGNEPLQELTQQDKACTKTNRQHILRYYGGLYLRGDVDYHLSGDGDLRLPAFFGCSIMRPLTYKGYIKGSRLKALKQGNRVTTLKLDPEPPNP